MIPRFSADCSRLSAENGNNNMPLTLRFASLSPAPRFAGMVLECDIGIADCESALYYGTRPMAYFAKARCAGWEISSVRDGAPRALCPVCVGKGDGHV
jgi:hypothetical protein